MEGHGALVDHVFRVTYREVEKGPLFERLECCARTLHRAACGSWPGDELKIRAGKSCSYKIWLGGGPSCDRQPILGWMCMKVSSRMLAATRVERNVSVRHVMRKMRLE